MKPRSNSFPSPLSNQIQSNNTAPPLQSQVFSANPSLPNLCNMFQNSMPMQPQLGIINPQLPIPFNSSNFPMPNMAPLITQQPAFFNQMGMPQMGFALQNYSNSMNTVPMFMNQLNSCQPQGQPFSVNFSNFPQHLNQSLGFPNLQNLMHNLNSVVPIPMPNPSQTVGPQNPNFFPNPPFAAGGQQTNTNQLNFAEQKTTARLNANSSTMPQTQNSRHSASFRKQGNTSSSNRKNFPRKEFGKNLKKETSKFGYQNSQFHHMNNGKRKFGLSNEHKGTGCGYGKATKLGRTGSTAEAGERKRSLALTYTEQEIKQWREERKKNFPSKANIKKKHSEGMMNSGVINEDAKLRREQLREILAKQAELGVEVAEIPSHYISDSEKQVNEREDNRSGFAKKGRSWNKHDKRGRYNKKDQLAKKQASVNKASSNMSSFNKSKPTLLQKLLSADVRRDKRHLLQALRFMVINSFFENWPQKALKFPTVVVKEGETKDGAGTERSLLSGKNFFEVKNQKTAENFGHFVGNGNQSHDNDAHAESELERKCSLVEEIERTEEEEEGEIIN